MGVLERSGAQTDVPHRAITATPSKTLRCPTHGTRSNGPVLSETALPPWALDEAPDFGYTPAFQRDAQVAQLVEHCTENAGVGGSNPPLGTILSYCYYLGNLDLARADSDGVRTPCIILV